MEWATFKPAISLIKVTDYTLVSLISEYTKIDHRE